ncbi:hypothetical protein RintRC_6759 [Richelia intracellularis]|nr:hypothetical protein RintRC_6759 [Richelia intracellularis]
MAETQSKYELRHGMASQTLGTPVFPRIEAHLFPLTRRFS